VEYSEQLSQLSRLHIPNRNIVTNPRTYSIFEHLMNFQRDSNLLEKSDKFSKIPSLLELQKSEFSWVHLYVRLRVTKQVPKRLGCNKRKEFEFEIQTLQYLIYEPNLRGFPASFRNT
jgi:hypothetical protein